MLEEARRLVAMSCPPAYILDNDFNDELRLEARMICTLRPGDVIVLRENLQLHLLWSFMQHILGLREDQVLWVSSDSYFLDYNIKKKFEEVQSRTSKGRWVIWPYSVTPTILEWASHLPHEIFGDTQGWVDMYSDKTVLHESIVLNSRGTAPFIGNFVPQVLVPKGYVCCNGPELRLAYNRLVKQGVKRFIVKACLGSTGEGIEEILDVRQLDDYRFEMGHVVLEEYLQLDQDCYGVISSSVQFNGAALLGKPTRQLLSKFAFAGNAFPAEVPIRFLDEVVNFTQTLLDWMKPVGPGGFDFLCSRGRAYLVDVNVGRFTGAHPPRMFVQQYAPGSAFISWQSHPKVSVEKLWEQLGKLRFVPGQSKAGTFPLYWLEEIGGMLIAVAQTRAEAELIKLETEKVL